MDSLKEKISKTFLNMTPKNRKVGKYILNDPVKVTAMSTRSLARACGVSEATVVRFVQKLGYGGYGEFQNALIKEIEEKIPSYRDSNIAVQIAGLESGFTAFVESKIKQTIAFASQLDQTVLGRILDKIQESSQVFLVGDLGSYSLALRLGWILGEIRPEIRVLDGGHDRTGEILLTGGTDYLVIFVVEQTCTNCLVGLSRLVRHSGLFQVVIADRLPCPLMAYADLSMTGPNTGITGAGLAILFRFMARELEARDPEATAGYRARLAGIRLDQEKFFQRSDTLKIGRLKGITTLDPARMASLTREFTLLNCIYNGLVKYREGTAEIVPDLANSWDVSGDGREITFYLRRGVVFHRDYGEMTAEDVKFTIERVWNPENQFGLDPSPFADMWKPLEAVEIINLHTVKLILKHPYPSLFTSILPFNTGMVVCKRAVEEMGAAGFSLNPVGTGPYQFSMYRPDHLIEMTTFLHYKGPSPIKKLVFSFQADKAGLEENMAAGHLDVVQLPLMNIRRLSSLPNLEMTTLGGQQVWWVGFTMNRPCMKNLKLRQAIRAALDVDKLLETTFFGMSDRANSLLPPGQMGFWEDAPVYKQDLSKARYLMAESGFGEGLRLRLLMTPSEHNRTMVKSIKADLGKIDIQVDVDVRDTGAYNRAAKKEGCDLFLSYFYTTPEPGLNMRWFKTGQEWNLGQWCSKAYDESVDKAEVEMDFNKRECLYIRAQEIMDQDCMAVWLTHGNGIVVWQKNIDIGLIFPNGELAPWTIKKIS